MVAKKKTVKKRPTGKTQKAANPLAELWRRVEEALDGSALAPPLSDSDTGELDQIFEFVLDQFSLPDPLRQSYAVHDGERVEGRLVPGLRLVSAKEASSFALALVGQVEPNATVKAWKKAEAGLERSLKEQGLSQGYCNEARWTLAVGTPGHRIYVDCNDEAVNNWIIEERPRGTVRKLADNLSAWLEDLSAGRRDRT